MNRRNAIWGLLAAACITTLPIRNSPAAAAECLSAPSTIELFGQLGKEVSISMKLIFHDHRVDGSYAYVRYNKPIPLSGSCAGGTLALQESDSSSRPTGYFRGSFSKPEMVEGTWSTPDGKKSMPFQLQALSPTDQVSGRYIMGDYLARKPEYGAELNILLLDDGRLRVQGNALIHFGAPGNFNVGEVDGTAKLAGDEVHYIDDASEPDSCHFTIRFMPRAINVTDDNMACGGVNVTFDGGYKRVGPPNLRSPLDQVQSSKIHPAEIEQLSSLAPDSVLSSRSQKSNTPTTVNFVNSSGDPVDLCWVNYDGARVLYKHLGPGESSVQQTYVTHPWVIYDDRISSYIAGFLPVKSTAEAIISPPSRQSATGKPKTLIRSDSGCQATGSTQELAH